MQEMQGFWNSRRHPRQPLPMMKRYTNDFELKKAIPMSNCAITLYSNSLFTSEHLHCILEFTILVIFPVASLACDIAHRHNIESRDDLGGDPSPVDCNPSSN